MTPESSRARPDQGSGQVPHGTETGYSYHRCRCQLCRKAATEYRRQRREQATTERTPHGTPHGYLYHGCQCEPCRSAYAKYKMSSRKRLRPADQIPHGTNNAYINYSCRCAPCRKAGAAAAVEKRRRSAERRLRSGQHESDQAGTLNVRASDPHGGGDLE